MKYLFFHLLDGTFALAAKHTAGILHFTLQDVSNTLFQVSLRYK